MPTDPCIVRLFNNGIVMVFDFKGMPMVELQGDYLSVRDKIMERRVPATRFELCVWDAGVVAKLSPNEFQTGGLSK